MAALEQYFPVVLFIMLYKMILTFASVDEFLECVIIQSLQMKATEQFFPRGAVRYAAQSGPSLSLWMKSLTVTIQMTATQQYFLVVLFIMLYKVVLSV